MILYAAFYSDALALNGKIQANQSIIWKRIFRDERNSALIKPFEQTVVYKLDG